MNFQPRINELEEMLELADEGTGIQQNCVPTLLIVGALIPFIISLVLYLTTPKFIQYKDKKSWSKITQYTILFTIPLWLLMYLFTFNSVNQGAFLSCFSFFKNN